MMILMQALFYKDSVVLEPHTLRSEAEKKLPETASAVNAVTRKPTGTPIRESWV